MYNTKVSNLDSCLITVKNNKLKDTISDINPTGRIVLKGGLVVDPKNNVEKVQDIIVNNGEIEFVGDSAATVKGDVVISCEDLIVMPGLIDMHLHLGDLFEVSTDPIYKAASDGVTIGLSPGAGNTFMAPSLLGAEVDRGLPLNIGVYQGAGNVLSTMLSVEEVVNLYKGELDDSITSTKMTRNPITNTTAPLVMGIKDHMGHFIMSDSNIDKIFEITSKANLIYMSHTQDPAHTERLVNISNGRPLHLGHTTAAGCGTHMDAALGMKKVIDFCTEEHITGEFVTTMLREGGGCREGLKLSKEVQEIAYQALRDKVVDILVSDGQNDATMKGFGDTRDNIPAIIELVEKGVLSLKDSVATMTYNPAKLIAKRTNNPWWVNKVGHIGEGALGNITIVDKSTKKAAYVLVNGEIVTFENKNVRRGSGAGGFVSKFGMSRKTGVGDITMFSYEN